MEHGRIKREGVNQRIDVMEGILRKDLQHLRDSQLTMGVVVTLRETKRDEQSVVYEIELALAETKDAMSSPEEEWS